VRRKLAEREAPDYITLSGSGEPTLYSRLGELIAGLKALSGVPVAVLTNGTLLWQREVQDALMQADLVVPSLDAATDEDFRRVNRPDPSLSLGRVIDGLIAFRKRFAGQYWLEVLLVGGITDTEQSVSAIAAVAGRIRPDRVQLNTVVRPPAERFARAVPYERLAVLAQLFSPPAEVVTPFDKHSSALVGPVASSESVLEMLRRRPCSLSDIAGGLGISAAEAAQELETLLREQRIRPRPAADGTVFYSA
jgi:wyosine [tRNA(Phe)-imidazoG37] synthetase (radical SAM superfamily)